MAKLTVIFDDKDETSLEFRSVIAFAIDIAERDGFEIVGRSNVSEAVYLAKPDCAGRLRIAAHGGRRDEVIAAAIFPQEKRLVDGDYQACIPLTPDAAFGIVSAAIAAYGAMQ